MAPAPEMWLSLSSYILGATQATSTGLPENLTANDANVITAPD